MPNIEYTQDTGYYIGTMKDITDGLNDTCQVIARELRDGQIY